MSAFKTVVYLFCLLIFFSAPVFAASGAKSYVNEVVEKLEKLQTKRDAASLLNEMNDLDNEISNYSCARESQQLKQSLDNEVNQRRQEFNRCFEHYLKDRLRRYPQVAALKLRTYAALNDHYITVMSRHFPKLKNFNPGRKLMELEQEVREFKDKHDEIAGVLVSTFGDVYIAQTRTSDVRKARTGTLLLKTAKLQTGAKARARVELVDYYKDKNSGPSVFNIASSTVIHIQDFKHHWEWAEGRKTGLIDMIRGVIRIFAKGWGGEAAFSVRTGTSLCGIRGTDIEISHEPELDRTFYRLRKGSVVIETPYERFTLKAGYQVTVTAGDRGEISPIPKGAPHT